MPYREILRRDAQLVAVLVVLLSLLDTGFSAISITKALVFGTSVVFLNDQRLLFLAVVLGTVLTALPCLSLIDMTSMLAVSLAVPHFYNYDAVACLPILSAKLVLFSALGTLIGHEVNQPFFVLSLGAGLALWRCRSSSQHRALNAELSAVIEASERYKAELGRLRYASNFQKFKHNPITSLRMKRILSKLKSLKTQMPYTSRRGSVINSPTFAFTSQTSEEIEQEKEDYESISECYVPSMQTESDEDASSEHAVTSMDSSNSLSADEVEEIINSMINRDFNIYSHKNSSKGELMTSDAKKRLTQATMELQPSSLKVYRRLQTLSKVRRVPSILDFNENLTELLEHVGDWNFNILTLIQCTHEPLTEVGTYVFSTLEFNEAFSIPRKVTKKFLSKVESCYHDTNYYHNSLHAADVMCSVVFLVHKGLQLCYSLLEIDIFALIVAALAHDIGHPGLNNAYLIATSDPLAIQYNDQSVLENMHCTTLFRILQRSDCNILANLSKGDQQAFRKVVIKTILATDLQKHFEMVRSFRAKMEETERPSLDDEKFRLSALELCVKCADLGHGAKKLELHKQWSGLITKEFYAQGELEEKLGLPVSSMNSRTQNILSSSQQGFLNVLVKPLFEVWEDFVKKFSEETDESEMAVLTCMNNIRENLAYWAHEHELYTQGTPSFELDDLPPPMLRNKLETSEIAYSPK